jgi:ubiquitin-protein ligase
MIERFEENLNGIPIGDYFQVPIKITAKYPDMMNITCRFSEKKKYNEIYIKLEVPFEINCLILSYLTYYSYGEYQIIVPNDYPFKPPLWLLINTNESMNSLNSNDSNHSNHSNKYKKAEIYHNVEYRNSWEPSISFEKDILYMIQKIMD